MLLKNPSRPLVGVVLLLACLALGCPDSTTEPQEPPLDEQTYSDSHFKWETARLAEQTLEELGYPNEDMVVEDVWHVDGTFGYFRVRVKRAGRDEKFCIDRDGNVAGYQTVRKEYQDYHYEVWGRLMLPAAIFLAHEMEDDDRVNFSLNIRTEYDLEEVLGDLEDIGGEVLRKLLWKETSGWPAHMATVRLSKRQYMEHVLKAPWLGLANVLQYTKNEGIPRNTGETYGQYP